MHSDLIGWRRGGGAGVARSREKDCQRRSLMQLMDGWMEIDGLCVCSCRSDEKRRERLRVVERSSARAWWAQSVEDGSSRRCCLNSDDDCGRDHASRLPNLAGVRGTPCYKCCMVRRREIKVGRILPHVTFTWEGSRSGLASAGTSG